MDDFLLKNFHDAVDCLKSDGKTRDEIFNFIITSIDHDWPIDQDTGLDLKSLEISIDKFLNEYFTF